MIQDDVEKILRGILVRGWELGKEQSETPYEYTLGTNEVETELKESWKKLTTYIEQRERKAVEGFVEYKENGGGRFYYGSLKEEVEQYLKEAIKPLTMTEAVELSKDKDEETKRFIKHIRREAVEECLDIVKKIKNMSNENGAVEWFEALHTVRKSLEQHLKEQHD